ncbi:NUDIX domain-containing protein [Candidatus Parcubacteria bacterium]|nr:NUDIX domain-containing protein [Patescibacteria group bacterium]MCG2688732.1 NUDIX domain-containing protein [Candidatus Parcubacteria bacterium]
MEKRNQNIEVCARAVIMNQGRILICWHKLNNHYFFPGGHVEYGELAEKALSRELKEELDIKIKKALFIGLTENIYEQKGEPHHEINLVFQVFTDKVKDKSMEDYIDFSFFSQKEFRTKRVLPPSLQKSVLKWLKDKKTFRICEVRS